MRTAYVVAPEADAADAVQEAFLKAYARAAAIPRGRAIPAMAAQDRRERGTQSAAIGRAAVRSRITRRGVEPGSSVAASPEAEVLAAETRDHLRRALAVLRDEDREVIGARYLARTFGGRDGRVALPADGHGEVADLARARTVAQIARRHRGRTGRWLTSRCHGCTSPPTKASRTPCGRWPTISRGRWRRRPMERLTSPALVAARLDGAPPGRPGHNGVAAAMDLATRDQGSRHRIGRAARYRSARRRSGAWTPRAPHHLRGTRAKPDGAGRSQCVQRRGAVGSSASPSAPTGSTGAARRRRCSPVRSARSRARDGGRSSAVDALAGFHVPRPPNGTVGPPDATWIDGAHNEQVALVWASSATLPDTTAPGVGLIEMAFRGKIDEGWFKKIVGTGPRWRRSGERPPGLLDQR